MDESILNSVKKVLNVPADYSAFDQDIIMHVNSAFSTLHQLGLGPVLGFEIEDDEPTWAAFTQGDPRLNSVRTYVYLKVRLVFDPPTLSFVQESMQRQIGELEWRLNVVRENDKQEAIGNTGETIFDGGAP